MKKKIVSLLLTCAMAISVLAGCGNQQSVSSEQPVVSEEVAEEAAEEKEVIALRLLCYGTMSERMEDFFANEYHDKVLEELKIDLTVEYVPWGCYGELATMMAGGESFAVMNMPTDTLAKIFHEDGYILELDPAMIEEAAPNYVASRNGMGFDCVKVGGKYWALPIGSKVTAGDNTNISVLNNYLEEVGTSYDQIKTMDDFMEAAAAVKEKHPNMWIWPYVESTIQAFPEVVSPEGTLYVKSALNMVAIDQLSGEATPTYGSELFENVCKLNEKFYELGYSSDANLTDNTFALTQWNSGNSLTYLGYAEKAINHELAGVEGSDQRYLKIGDAPLYKSKDYDWAISFAKGEEENLDRWLELFDWIYASEENYLFSIYGVEGEDWNRGTAGEVVPTTSDRMFPDWMFGSMMYTSFDDKDPADVEEYTAMESGDVILDKSLGFSFNTHPENGVDYEVIETALVTIRDEKIKPLAWGYGNYDTDFPAILEELKAAGYDDYCAEWIRQYDEWRSAN